MDGSSTSSGNDGNGVFGMFVVFETDDEVMTDVDDVEIDAVGMVDGIAG